MKTRKRELAKAGIFGSADNPIIVTEKDLREIAETFPDQKTAPVQFGHWADAASPRLGNVVSVSYDEKEKSLTGEIEEHDVLFDAVEQGFFPDVSIGAKKRASDGKMYLHHLAYLGEEPPAIKDLKKSIGDALDNAAAEKVAASDTASGELIQMPSAGAARLYLSDTKPEKEKTSMTEEEIKAMQEENARLKAANEANEKLLADSARNRLEAEKEQLKKAAAGKIPEGDTAKLLNLCDAFESGRTIELSDADGGTKKESPVAVLSEIFSHIKLPVEPGEMNLSDTAAAEGQQRKNYASMMEKM